MGGGGEKHINFTDENHKHYLSWPLFPLTKSYENIINTFGNTTLCWTSKAIRYDFALVVVICKWLK